MSMLAERKRKTKWVINPTKKPLWTTDSNGIKFGKELMEKMGWSAGKGLGVNEQGIQEPLRVSYKNDTKGMGFKGNDDDWIEQQDEFNELLCQLRNEDTSNVNISKKEIKSLEEKSKQSRARVHYQKFTRGKDLSQYSENDLACILGTNKIKKEKSKTEEVVETDSKAPDTTFETSFGVTTINSGSIQDYFKKKWIFDKNSEDLPVQNKEVKNCTQNPLMFDSCFVEKNKENSAADIKEKNLKKKKHKSYSEEELMSVNKTNKNELDALENVENNPVNMKEEVENGLKEPKAKKRKKYYDENDFVEETLSGTQSNFADPAVYNYESENLVKKKKRKDKNDLRLEDNNSDCVVKKKRKNSYENCTSDVLSCEKLENIKEEENASEFELYKKKKKKKSKKENVKENCVIKGDPITSVNNQSDGEEPEPVLEVESVKKIKKDKEKLARSEKHKNVNCDNQNYDDIEEKIVELHANEDSDINSVRKKKKKKNEKENSDEIECNFSFQIEEDLKGSVIANELDYKMKTEFIKKKKVQKDKKEKETKSVDKEKEKVNSKSMNCHSDQKIEVCLEVPAKEKIINEEIIKTSVYKSMPEMEPVNKKKKKKKKEKEKLEEEINGNGYTKERTGEIKIDVNEEENIFEVKVVKKKKKSKHKKESEDLKLGMGHFEEPIIDMSQEEYPVERELTKKKKKKKEKKESKSPNQQSEETEKLCFDKAFKEKIINIRVQENALKMKLLENACKPEAEANERAQIEKTNGKPNTETVDKKGFIDRNKINGSQEEDKGVHQHKVALLNEKRADKFYPGGYDRVLRLTLWTNIAGFKGSNLEDVLGYGNRRKSERNKSS